MIKQEMTPVMETRETTNPCPLSVEEPEENGHVTFTVYGNFDRKIIPDIALRTTIIAGFPGETDEDFNNTIKLVKKIKFINSYSFIFSPRPGTAASNLKLINQKVAQERLNLIQTELFSHQNYKNKMTKNKIVNVLVENKIKNQNKFFGRTEYMTAVIFDGEENIEGKIVPVLITHYNQNNLFGEIKLNKNIKAA